MERRLPPLHDLPPSKIQELIGDLRLQQAGHSLHYVIDPTEIDEFCFPLDPTSLRRKDIDIIADDQAALFEIFYIRSEPPVLLQQYRPEVQDSIDYFERVMDNVYTKSDMIDAFISEGGLAQLAETPDQLPDDLLRVVQQDFNVMLAAAMGIFSLGIERFREILGGHLFFEGIGTQDPVVLRAHHSHLEEDHTTDPIVESIIAEVEKFPAWSESRTIQRRRYAMMDALAINHVLSLNSSLEEAYQQGKIPKRHVYLYLSSAPRNARIFELPGVREALPVIDGNPYPIWRSRAQIFAYAVHKGRANSLEETVSNLVNVKRIIEEARDVGKEFANSVTDCPKCVLEGAQVQECKWLDFCLRVKSLDEAIQAKRAEIQNLELVNQLSNYESLRRARPAKKSHRDYLAFFSQFYENDFAKRATERTQELQWLILTKSEFARMLPSALGIGRAPSTQALLRAGRDAIIGISQYLPLRPRVESPEYQEIVGLVKGCYRVPPQGEYRLDLIDKAYKLFIDIDTKKNSTDPLHELLRCLLYLAFPKISGDRKAFEHAQNLLQRPEVLGTHPEMKLEFRYVQLWAARRLKEYQTADEIATESIAEWRDDPRFYHGRSLNTFSWLMDSTSRATCPHTLSDAVADARHSIAYITEVHNASFSEEDTEMIGVNWNNIAYFLALIVKGGLGSPEERRKALDEARNALKELKRHTRKDRGGWRPEHPEYYHTEAAVEYQEYLYQNDNNADIEVLIFKLDNALREIEAALELYPRDLYTDERDEILAELIRLKDERASRIA